MRSKHVKNRLAQKVQQICSMMMMMMIIIVVIRHSKVKMSYLKFNEEKSTIEKKHPICHHLLFKLIKKQGISV